MSDLKGKSAIVMGAAAGNVGGAIARRFSELGADVTVAGRNETAIKEFGREQGLTGQRCDITAAQDLADLAGFVVDRYGKIDIAVNAVGVNLVRPLLDVTRAELDAVINAQVVGPVLFLQAMIRHMQQGGSIIQISSVTSQALLPDHAIYMATKAAGDMLVRSAAFDFGHRGIRVNSLSPGATLDAPMAGAIMQDAAAREAIRELIPLGRIGTTDDIADAAAWLASDWCFMTGENLQINGGIALQALSPPPSTKQDGGA